MLAVTALFLTAVPALTALSLLGAVPAGADPRLDVEAVLAGVTPVLPAAVSVAVVPSVAQEVVVTNPTATVLTVLDRAGVPFLRIGDGGVSANVASPDWYLSNDPEASTPVPASARYGAAVQWAVVTADDTWGWFDPRVQPPAVLPPALAVLPKRHSARIDFGGWQVPLRYGPASAVMAGSFAYQPEVGAFRVVVDRPPTGLTVSVLQGRLPGVYLSVARGLTVTVYGIDGRPFLRVGPAGAYADPTSRSWVLDRQARGLPLTPPSAPTASRASAPSPTPAPPGGWVRIAGGPAVDWLDPRLTYPSLAPPDPGRAAVVRRWSVPVEVGTRRVALEGTVDWVPTAVASDSAAPGSATASGPAGGGMGMGVAAAASSAAALAAFGLLFAGRAWSRRRPGR